MFDFLAGLLVAALVGFPHAWAERHGPLPLYIGSWVLVIAGVVGLFTFGHVLLIDTDSILVLLGYVAGFLGVQQLANNWWGRDRFWRRR